MCAQIEQALLTLALQMLWSPRYITRKGLAQGSSSGTPLMYHIICLPDVTLHAYINRN